MRGDGSRVFVIADFGRIRFEKGLFFLELQEDFFTSGEMGDTVRELVLSPSSFLTFYNNIDASVSELTREGAEGHGQDA